MSSSSNSSSTSSSTTGSDNQTTQASELNLGDTVSGSEAQEVLDRVDQGETITGLEDRPDLSSQIAQQTGVDARAFDADDIDQSQIEGQVENVDINLSEDGFSAEVTQSVTQTETQTETQQQEEQTIDQSRQTDQIAADLNRRLSGSRRSRLNSVISNFEEQLDSRNLTTDNDIQASDIIQDGDSFALDQDVDIDPQESFRFDQDNRLRDLTESAQEAAETTSDFISDISSQPLTLPTSTAVEIAADQEVNAGPRDKGPFVESATRGAGELFNVPSLVSTGLQAAETISVAEQRILQDGETDQVVSDLTDAAEQRLSLFESQIRQRPVETAGLAAGSLVFSTAAISTANRISSTAGGAVRGVIQPGEEIAGIAGNRATRALAGDRTAERLFPQNEPLIFSEEAAIRAASGASQRVRAGISNARQSNTLGAGLGSLAQTEVEVKSESELLQPEIETDQEPEIEIEPVASLEIETEQELLRPEINLFEEQQTLQTQQQPQLLDQQLNQVLEQVQSPEFDQEADQEQQEITQESELQQEFEIEAELQQEAEIESLQELEVETEQEVEVELELEQELEQEVETESELLPLEQTDDLDQQADQSFAGVRAIEATLVERDLDIQ